MIRRKLKAFIIKAMDGLTIHIETIGAKLRMKRLQRERMKTKRRV